MFFSVEKEF